MNKFILRSIYFYSPFLLLFLYYTTYNTPYGDLSRLGKISIAKDYRKKFIIDTTKVKPVKTFNSFLLNGGNSTIDLLTIGDSYSQNTYGYQAQMNSKYSIDTYNFQAKHLKKGNPVQTLFALINSGFIDSTNIKSIALQVVNRETYKYFTETDTTDILSIQKLKVKTTTKNVVKKRNNTISLFRDLIDYPIYSLLYHFDNKAYFSQVYQLGLNKDLFSDSPNTLLCYDRDITNIELHTEKNTQKINLLICQLSSKLKQKGIQLIYVPVPDKYDIYYNYLNDEMPINPFFSILRKQTKNYTFFDTKLILSKYLSEGVKDVYLFDDTHWSAVGHEIIANELYGLINK